MGKHLVISLGLYAMLHMGLAPVLCMAGESLDDVAAKRVAAELANAEIHVGKVLFKRKCARCHSAEEPVNDIGPYLYQVVGRRAATARGYDYSRALRTSGLVWTKANLIKYINNPRAYIPCRPIRIRALSMCPGIHMKFQGFRNIYAAKAVVAYLQSVGNAGTHTADK